MIKMVEKKSLAGKKISVVGAGVSGRALAELAADFGAKVFVSDIKKLDAAVTESFQAKGIRWEDNGNTDAVLDADEIIVSSGISPRAPIIKAAYDKGIKVIGELDFVSPYLSGKVIGVTGSNGKTTTTSMLGYYLKEMGRSVMTGGNIGNAAAHAAGKKYEFIVLELSSFQLYWAKDFKCDIAIVTNLAPDHIDWHGSYENYVASKANIIKCLSYGGAAIFQKRDEEALKITRDDIVRYPLFWSKADAKVNGLYLDSDSKTSSVSCGGNVQRLFSFDDVNLLGLHNLENEAMTLCALAIAGVTDVPTALIKSFVPPKHRCAFAGKVGGVTFVDDSKGTNVAASITAMTSLPNKKVMILGGQGKGEQYEPLAEVVKQQARAAVVIGTEKEKIAAALSAAGFVNYVFASGMDEAVRTAYSMAAEGDTVLLSPACTSWDMYPSYKVRGEHFCSIVKELAASEA